MKETNDIYDAIATEGFSAATLQMIDKLINDIQYGRKDFDGFTLPEHAGLCKGGAPLIGASVVTRYARRSLAAGGNAESGEGSIPANWQIDEEQERLIEVWAKTAGLWFEHSDSIIHSGGCFETLYLGVKIGDKAKDEIVNAARKTNPNLTIYQMATDNVAFKLNTEAL